MKFGTDGIRGLANRDVTPELALALGRASARVLGGPSIAVGRDPRWSGPMLEAAFVAGVLSEGVSVELLGVVPTPAVAYRAQVANIPAAMISASHNPFGDNGIKVFAAGGLKLADAAQAELERALAETATPGDVPIGRAVGRVEPVDVSAGYLAHLLGSLGGTGVPLDGMSIVLDCGHGAASALAERAFVAAGAAVTMLNVSPDGANINDNCGSTNTSGLSEAVVSVGADLGFAFDGDADRMLAVDRHGDEVDGDHLIAIAAIDMKARGLLTADTVVVTVMTNLGFRKGMQRHAIAVVDTNVGDRYVLEALDSGGFVLGGEQSGHIIFRDRATTGDGMLSAMMIAEVVARSGHGLDHLADEAMTRMPQVLENVRIASPMPDVTDRIADAIAEATTALGADGRVLVRPSGTEPVVRVMIEAADLQVARHWAGVLGAAVAAI